MTEEQNDYQLAIASLKAILKAQKITYRELAQGVGLSESGVKKILSAEDGSFQRLAEMCRFIGVSLTELFESSRQPSIGVSFAEQAQEFFIEHPNAFALYWRLVYERVSLEEAEKLQRLDKKESFKILRQLDKLGLVSLLPGGRVRVPAVRRVRWVGDGPLFRKLYREWVGAFLRTVARPDLPDGELFFVRYFKVFPKTYRDLLKAQRDLEAEFERRAIQDMRTHSPELVHLRWMAAVDDRSFLGD